jgi:serine/threonine protein kinase/Flp pilus assembly protein TadD
MNLVELAMRRPPEEREAFLRSACDRDVALFDVAWDYVQWNGRMRDFLLEPLCSNRREGPPGGPDDTSTRTMAYAAHAEEPLFHPDELLLNRFRIVREVARGGMGIVYEARDEKLGRRIALKCARSGYQKRLPPEVRHASEVSHPNVCRIFEIHTVATPRGEIDFFTMEFLEGETLRSRLSAGPLPEGEALAIGRQICAGVAAAHRHNVVHGDLKSNNVILARDADGSTRAVVTDFGLASGPVGVIGETVPGQAGASPAGGTPGYMAPELWKGESPSVASDVYALGVTLYEVVADRRPYPRDFSWQDRLKPPPDVDHAWNPILQRCLLADPAKRFRDASEVSVALEPSHTRRWWIGAVAAIVLAAISGWVTYQRAAPPKPVIRLAMLTLQPDASAPGSYDANVAERLSRDAATRLASLTAGTRVRLSVVPWSDVARSGVDTPEKARGGRIGATHVVHGTIASINGKLEVHAFLSGEPAGEWAATYNPGEAERYAPGAIAGMVTYALHLDPLKASVNARASKDYQDGLRLTRRNSTIDSALPAFDRAVAVDPDSPLTWAGQAEARWFKYYLTRDSAWLDLSKESLRQARNRNLDLAPVHRVSGLLLKNEGSYEKAAEDLRRAIELEPTNGDAYRRMGQVYMASGDNEKALEMNKLAVRVQPNDFKTHQDLGYFFGQESEYDRAAVEYEKSVKLAPDEADVHRFLGVSYRHLYRYGDAERELREAVRLAPTPNSFGALAATLMYMERDREAIDYLSSAVSLSPDNSFWWMPLGIAYGRTGQLNKSLWAFRRGLDAAEKAPNPRDGEVLSRVAFLSARLHDRGRARFDIKTALELSPSLASVIETAVWTYDALGQEDDAVKILEHSPIAIIEDVASWPDLAGLHANSRFKELLESRNIHSTK